MNGFTEAFRKSLFLKIFSGVTCVALAGTIVGVVWKVSPHQNAAVASSRFAIDFGVNSAAAAVKGAPALFSDPDGTYNYCPSVIQTDAQTRYIYYCSNKDAKVIKDYIVMRKGTLTNGTWKWSGRKYVLSPSDTGWDSNDACDPDVVEGSFLYNGTAYPYLMAYLGCASFDNTRNEIGIAFSISPEGPWVKYSGNPVVSYDAAKYGVEWGVGQPSLISRDHKGKVYLFYTRGDKYSTRGCMQEMDLSNLSKPSFGQVIDLPVTGLSEIDKSNVVLSNFDLALDTATNRFYGIRDRHPYESSLPDNISSQLQLFSGDGDLFYNASKPWAELTNITQSQTGWPRNHNASIVTDAYGDLPVPGKIEIAYTSSNLGASNTALWTYRIHSYTVDLSKIS